MPKIIPIYTYNHSILKTSCEELQSIPEDLLTLTQNMLATMYNAKGVGLSANQIGSKYKLFVIDNGLHDTNRRSAVCINPEIIDVSEETLCLSEACLSIPKINIEIVRPMEIIFKYLDEKFVERQFETSDNKGMLARAIQHEIDHLNGKLIIDYLNKEGNSSSNEEINRRLKNIAHGNSGAKYLTINK